MNVEMKIVSNINVLSISGNFTFNTLGDIRNTLKKDIASASSAKFLVDLTQVGLIDSTALGTIISIYKTVLSRKGTFGVIVQNGDVKDVFFTVGLNKLFPIFDDEAQGIKSV